MTRKRWTKAQLLDLYRAAFPGAATPNHRRDEYAADARAALEAPTLDAAARELTARGWWDSESGARKLRKAAGIVAPGKCPTCGRE